MAAAEVQPCPLTWFARTFSGSRGPRIAGESGRKKVHGKRRAVAEMIEHPWLQRPEPAREPAAYLRRGLRAAGAGPAERGRRSPGSSPAATRTSNTLGLFGHHLRLPSPALGLPSRRRALAAYLHQAGRRRPSRTSSKKGLRRERAHPLPRRRRLGRLLDQSSGAALLHRVADRRGRTAWNASRSGPGRCWRLRRRLLSASRTISPSSDMDVPLKENAGRWRRGIAVNWLHYLGGQEPRFEQAPTAIGGPPLQTGAPAALKKQEKHAARFYDRVRKASARVAARSDRRPARARGRISRPSPPVSPPTSPVRTPSSWLSRSTRPTTLF